MNVACAANAHQASACAKTPCRRPALRWKWKSRPRLTENCGTIQCFTGWNPAFFRPR